MAAVGRNGTGGPSLEGRTALLSGARPLRDGPFVSTRNTVFTALVSAALLAVLRIADETTGLQGDLTRVATVLLVGVLAEIPAGRSEVVRVLDRGASPPLLLDGGRPPFLDPDEAALPLGMAELGRLSAVRRRSPCPASNSSSTPTG